MGSAGAPNFARDSDPSNEVISFIHRGKGPVTARGEKA